MLTAGKVFVLMACFSLCIASLSAELQRFQHSVKDDGSLSFLVIGDWGRRGFFNQSKVAHQMGRIGEEMKIDFVVSSGDNFYNNGLISTEDPLFEDSFSKIYTANSLQQQWFSVLGNHDYRGDVEVQLSPILRRKDSRWLCLRSYVLHTEIADFFFVDTTPFVDKYFLKPSYHRYDWRGVLPRDKYLTMLLKDLELAMKKSSAEWKIVVGHHTMRSIGHHGNTKELLRRLLPVLEANNVDMYINGHDHCLQHITSTKSPIHFLTSGGGSKAWKGRLYERKQEDFFYDGQGFMAVHLTPSRAKVAFYDIFGQVMHHFNLSKMYHTAM